MVQLANITVKKNDGTTDVVYTGTHPAAGDAPSIHYGPALGAVSTTRPELRVRVQAVGDGMMKRVTGTFMMPYHIVNSTTNVTSIQRKFMGKLEFTVPQDMPQTIIDEGCSQAVNLFASTAFKDAVKTSSSFV